MLSLLVALFVGFAHAEDAWTTRSVEMTRWPVAIQPNAVVRTLDVDSQVSVVVRRDKQVRVRASGAFGWVDAAALTTVAPKPAVPAGDDALPFE